MMSRRKLAITLLGIVLISAIVLGSLTSALARPPTIPIQGEELAAMQVASQYLTNLADGEFDNAYNALAPAVRQQIPLTTFMERKRAQLFVFWDLQEANITGSRAVVHVRYLTIPSSGKFTAEQIRQLPEQRGSVILIRMDGKWYLGDPDIQ
ncbi:MAG: hypothetical protein C4294_19535 [Nitrospiraceae bacterium]